MDMVSTLEHHPTALFDARPITLKEYVLVELLLEIDCIDMKKGGYMEAIIATILSSCIIPRNRK